MIGQILSKRYEIIAKIGDGGMALVYSAKDNLLNRLVAVKVLREQYANDSEFIERFHHEAQAAASLSHPNVVNVYDVGTINNTPFIVMEYVEGENLSEIIKKRGILEPDYVIKIAVQICAALAHAHKHKIVHRDIKPHNILITKDNEVKVTDFGIAAISSLSITQTGVVLGSVLYFSPEQARGNKVDHFSDLYSLGVVMYEMLGGRVPFRGDTPISVALKHIQDLPKLLSELNSDIPPSLEQIVHKLLAKTPSDRYESAIALSQALEKLNLTESLVQTQKLDLDLSEVIAEQTKEGEADLSATKRKKKSKRRLPIFLLILFLFSGLLFTFFFILPEVLFPKDVEVPSVLGLSVEAAEELLAERNLKLAIDIEVSDNEIPVGHIISQDPRPNRMKKENQYVLVRVSKGPEYKDMISVIGLSSRDAQVKLTQSGFTLGETEYEEDPDFPVNTVIRQNPAPGDNVPAGLPVDLVMSQGVDIITTIILPDFRGENIDFVRQQIADLGLKEGSIIPEYSTIVTENQVVEQNPAPTTEVELGWTVDLVYSQGLPSTDRADSGGVERWTTDGTWRENQVKVEIPEGRDQEVVILVVDDFGAREFYRETHKGGSSFTKTVQGRGENARIQVYIGGRLFIDRNFVE